MLDLAPLEARCAAATPEKWRYGTRNIDVAAFVLAARSDVPALIAEVKRLRAENALLGSALVGIEPYVKPKYYMPEAVCDAVYAGVQAFRFSAPASEVDEEDA